MLSHQMPRRTPRLCHRRRRSTTGPTMRTWAMAAAQDDEQEVSGLLLPAFTSSTMFTRVWHSFTALLREVRAAVQLEEISCRSWGGGR